MRKYRWTKSVNDVIYFTTQRDDEFTIVTASDGRIQYKHSDVDNWINDCINNNTMVEITMEPHKLIKTFKLETNT